MRDAGDGAARRCVLLSADASVVMGGFGASVVKEVGLIGRLIELHDRGLNPLADLLGGILGYG